MMKYQSPWFEEQPPSLRGRTERMAEEKEDLNSVTKKDLIDLKNLLYELRGCHTELEAQNEELKQSRQFLEDSQKKYLKHYDLSPIGLLRFDDKGLIIDANVSVSEMLDIPRVVLGNACLPIAQYLAPESILVFEDHLRELLRSGDPLSCELQFRKKDGEERYFQMQSVLHRIPGDRLEIYATLTDHTRLKQLEETLAKTQAENRRLTSVAKMTDNLICVTNREGDIEWVNGAFERITGYTLSEVTGKKLLSFFKKGHNIDPASIRDLTNALGIGHSSSLEIAANRKDGSKYWLQAGMHPERNPGGGITGFMFLGKDITERKNLEHYLFNSKENIRKDKEQLRLTMAQAPVGIYVLSLGGKFLRVNQALCNILGWSEDEMLRSDWAHITSPENLHVTKQLFGKIIDRHSEFEIAELKLRRQDGSEVDTICHFGVVRSSSREPEFLVGIIEDITGRKHQEEERLKVCKLESLGLLAGGIAHDLNNIIMGISMSLEMAIKDAEDDVDSEIVESLRDAKEAANRASDLSTRLLTFAKGGDPVKEVVEFSGCLESAVKFALRGSRIKAHYDIETNLPPIEIDKGQIVQVIENIVINAREASPTGGNLRVSMRSTRIASGQITELAPGAYNKITITDDGVGIPSQIITKIFDPYFTTKPKGNGIGLATCYSIMKKHGGTIKVESEENKGSSFELYFPVATSPDRVRSKDNASHSVAGSGKILVIDDDQNVLKLVSKALSSLGYEPSIATEGTQGCEMYMRAFESNEPFKAVLLDATIPGGIGGEMALRALLEKDPRVKVILCSGYADGNLLADWKELGFRDILQKPFTVPKLSHVLSRITVE